MFSGGQMRTGKDIRKVIFDYVNLNGGEGCLKEPDTPSFIRKHYGYSIVVKSHTGKRFEKAPGSITSLLNILFGEDDVKFAY